MGNSVEIGAVGWARYRFSNPEQARIATILAHYASLLVWGVRQQWVWDR
jgi:hypothetical protein